MISEGKLNSKSCWRNWVGLAGWMSGSSLDHCWIVISEETCDRKFGSERHGDVRVGGWVGTVWRWYENEDAACGVGARRRRRRCMEVTV